MGLLHYYEIAKTQAIRYRCMNEIYKANRKAGVEYPYPYEAIRDVEKAYTYYRTKYYMQGGKRYLPARIEEVKP